MGDVEEVETPVQFVEMGLDDRILEAIACLSWKEPTLIQEKAIPYMLEGKDILARARTGSGKTGAFAIPAIHKILEAKKTATEQMVRVLVLAPSKELAKQITEIMSKLTAYCKREVRIVDVSGQLPLDAQRPLLLDKPDIVVGTPVKILAHIKAGNLDMKKSLEILIIDEADLMFAFDHEKDVLTLLKNLPTICQSFVTSATMFEDVRRLKKLVLHNPIILKLEEPPLPTTAQLTQYIMKLEDFEKVVMIYALFRLNMIRGKTIIFVNTVDRGYKLRMFLGQFDISSCVLNSEMPVDCRCHIVEQFNQGKYDIIIASDEKMLEEVEARKGKEKSKRKKDKESGVSRGIDFQFVSNIINLDFPPDVDTYIHRVGRTARGNNQGTSLSLVAVKEMKIFSEVEEKLKTLMNCSGSVFKDFTFDMTQLDGFRYRAGDAWRRCTSIAIAETRKKELKQELLNSAKLRSFFEDNPRDLQLLRHDKAHHAMMPQPHLKNVPEYNIPPNLRKISKFIKKRKLNKKVPSREPMTRTTKCQIKYQKKKADPLKSMEFSGFKKD